VDWCPVCGAIRFRSAQRSHWLSGSLWCVTEGIPWFPSRWPRVAPVTAMVSSPVALASVVDSEPAPRSINSAPAAGFVAATVPVARTGDCVRGGVGSGFD